MKQKRDREEACSTCGHYHDYEGGEPCSICGHVLLPAGGARHESCMPATIITGFLYLGSYDTASRQDLLKAMGITHILNTVPSCQALYKNTFVYHTLEHSPPDFQECFKFLDMVNEQKSKVLVYCMSGASRSPAVVIAYLMKLRGWRLAESYKWVKDKRPQTKISEAETERLQKLEVQLLGSCSCPSGFAFINLPAFGTSSPKQHVQQQQQQQQPGLFGVMQPPPWAAGGPAALSCCAGSSSSTMAFTGHGSFVFGAAHAVGAAHRAAAPHAPQHVGEHDMEA